MNGWNNVVVLMHDAADKCITYESLEDVIKYLQKESKRQPHIMTRKTKKKTKEINDDSLNRNTEVYRHLRRRIQEAEKNEGNSL